MTDGVAYLRVRCALFCGVFGALGATVGWFVWVAANILSTRPGEVWVSALVGGVLGLLLDGFRRYRQATGKTDTGHASKIPVKIPVAALLFSMAGIFLAEAGQDTLGNLVEDVRIPLLFSVLTFFVGGVGVWAAAEAVGWLTDDDSDMEWAARVFGRAVGLFLIGAFIAVPLSLISMLADAGARYAPLAAWWTIISIVAGTAALTARRSLWRGALATVATIGAIAFSIPFFGFSSVDQADPNGWERLMVTVTQDLLSAPDVPSKMWATADAELRNDHAAQLLEPGMPLGASQVFTFLSSCDNIPSKPDQLDSAAAIARKTQMCQQAESSTSGVAWTRSAIVVACFALGMTWAVRTERRWRPEDYEHHPVRSYDRIGLILAATGVVVGAVLLRLIS